MKKAFDQTVRDLKREVNKKVLKVPGIEQKVLDATSNESWGPHGTLLAEIANASRDYHEYQLIMGVIWKRINDTGKNWRHVYKGLTVLEYLVANGSERVIDDIKEHAYQISTLSDFQYIDSSGRDQGNNVRKKSQSIVQLVNDKERIAEVRQKATANRNKFRNASSTGGMYRPNSYSGGYGDRFEDDRNGSGWDKESGYREDDRYGRYGDSYNRDGDHNSRDSDDRDGYRGDDFRGRSRSPEGQKYGSTSRSYDRDREHAYEEDGNYSSRADEQSQDVRPLERKFSEQNLGAPPGYEDAVSGGRSSAQSEKGGNSAANHISSPPPTVPAGCQIPSVPSMNSSTSSSPVTHHAPMPDVSHNTPVSSITSSAPTPTGSHSSPVPHTTYNVATPHVNLGVDSFDEFDPRGSFPAPAPPTYTNGTSGDFLSDALALVPVSIAETSAASHSSFSASAAAFDQRFEDPFGETPFRAIPQANSGSVQPEIGYSAQSYHPSTSQTVDPAQSAGHSTTESAFYGQNDQDMDILAGILPLTIAPQEPPPTSNQMNLPSSGGGFNYQHGPTAANGLSTQQNSGFYEQQVSAIPVASHLAHQTSVNATMQYNTGGISQPGSFQGASPMAAQHHPEGFIQRTSSAPLPVEHTKESFLPQYNPTQYAPQPSGVQSAAKALHPGQLGMAPKPANEKFESKSSIWADTLSRGLVNLNISGSKTNPMADIGVDFDALNRKEKRMEKPSAAPLISTITMGKAMGSGSGTGRTGASAVRPPPSPMVGSGMGMPNYGGMNQQAMGINRAPGIGMNYGIGQGSQMQQPVGSGYGVPQQPTIGGVGTGYSPQQPMLGVGYGPQQPLLGGVYGTQPPVMGGGYNPQQPYARGYQ